MEDRARAPLGARLRQRIELEGAISFHDWMEAALYDEPGGYYCRSDKKRWGRDGDYRTSPERSPLFAATFARYFASLYEELGRPAAWTIWEAGAGSGHFVQDALETLSNSYPEIFSRMRYVIDERDEQARSLHQERLAPFAPRLEYQTLSEATEPLDNLVIFANELLDAFPVHRVLWRQGDLRELFVGVNAAGEFIWIEREPSTPLLSAHISKLNIKLAEGQVFEINLHAPAWIRRAARIIKRGYLILVDYGAEAEELFNMSLRPEGSLRSFRGHSVTTDVLEKPGEQDITSTVDWTTIKHTCEESGLEIVSFMRQDRFLLQAGLLESLAQISARLENHSEALQLNTTAREMILPGGMSESFQVLVARKQ